MANRDTPVKPGDAPGYPEKQPRDKEDARKSGPQKKPDREEGGLGRDAGQDGKPDA